MAFIIYFSCPIHQQFLMILSFKPFPTLTPASSPLCLYSPYLYPSPSHCHLFPKPLQFPGLLIFFFYLSVIYSPDSLYVNHTESLLCLRAIIGFIYITLKLKPKQECASCFLFSLVLCVPPVAHSLPSMLPALSSLNTHDLSSSGLFALACPECCFPAFSMAG